MTIYDPQGSHAAQATTCPVSAYIDTDVSIHNPENINNCELVPKEARFCMLILSQKYGLGLV
jgi:hypothetical protein